MATPTSCHVESSILRFENSPRESAPQRIGNKRSELARTSDRYWPLVKNLTFSASYVHLPQDQHVGWRCTGLRCNRWCDRPAVGVGASNSAGLWLLQLWQQRQRLTQRAGSAELLKLSNRRRYLNPGVLNLQTLRQCPAGGFSGCAEYEPIQKRSESHCRDQRILTLF